MPASHATPELDHLHVAFDDTHADTHAVASAGLLLPATLADRLGIEAAADELVRLGGPAAANPGAKLLTVVHGMLAGGDCSDDVDVLRCGQTGSVLGHRVMAPSTVGTWLRAFTFGHTRQLDRVCEHALTRAWAAGAGPGGAAMTSDCDSTIIEVCGRRKQGASYGYTKQLGYHPLLATRADTGEVLHARLRAGRANTTRGMPRFCDERIARTHRAGAAGALTLRADSGFWSAKTITCLRRHRVRSSITVRKTKPVREAIAAIDQDAWTDIDYPDPGIAQVAQTRLGGDRLIVRRVRHVTDQQELFPDWQYHAFLTDRVGTTVWLDADHRRHAVVELAIRELKNGAGLNHCPRGGSPPTPPGCWPPPWPTTCCAGPR